MDSLQKAWSLLDEENAGFIVSMRLDISTFLEIEAVPPPVLFANFMSLKSWAISHGLMAQEIPGVHPTSAVRIKGCYQSNRCNIMAPYDQIWARATYTNYVVPLQHIALRGFNVKKAALVGIHADHIINRARLRDIPSAWVAIFPVSADTNSPFGRIEANLTKITPGFTVLPLPPLVAFKLFCGRLPSNQMGVTRAMHDIRGQFAHSELHVRRYLDQMEFEARKFF